jgi:hypothetical protein
MPMSEFFWKMIEAGWFCSVCWLLDAAGSGSFALDRKNANGKVGGFCWSAM